MTIIQGFSDMLTSICVVLIVVSAVLSVAGLISFVLLDKLKGALLNLFAAMVAVQCLLAALAWATEYLLVIALAIIVGAYVQLQFVSLTDRSPNNTAHG